MRAMVSLSSQELDNADDLPNSPKKPSESSVVCRDLSPREDSSSLRRFVVCDAAAFSCAFITVFAAFAISPATGGNR